MTKMDIHSYVMMVSFADRPNKVHWDQLTKSREILAMRIDKWPIS